MTPKALLIPIAAFAVTVTGVQAFDPEILKDAGLTDTQVEAFVEARELREIGDREKAREVLEAAGVDMDTMEKVREAMHAERKTQHDAIEAAITADDFDAFKEAIKNSPIADIVTTEADFKLFKEAHSLREAGDREAAQVIMEDLGFEHKDMNGHMHGRGGTHGKMSTDAFAGLSGEEREALAAARAAGDHEEVERILEEAGIVLPSAHGEGFGPRMF